MPSNSDVSLSRVRTPPAVIVSNWPLRDSPGKTLALLALELLAGILAAYGVGNWGMGAIVVALLGLASWQFLLPVSYELNSKGIQRRLLFSRRRVSWIEFEGFDVVGGAVFLRHQTHRDPFGSVRGLYLPLHTNRDDLLTVLDYYLRPRPNDAITTTQTLAH